MKDLILNEIDGHLIGFAVVDNAVPDHIHDEDGQTASGELPSLQPVIDNNGQHDADSPYD